MSDSLLWFPSVFCKFLVGALAAFHHARVVLAADAAAPVAGVEQDGQGDDSIVTARARSAADFGAPRSS